MKPNFFIIGAPKCGTTAISEYLRTHPAVFMSTPKEPSYFATDLPGMRYVDRLSDYEQLFDRAGPEHQVIGEASPSYLFSGEAIAQIAAYRPDAKILVMLRPPADMLPSYHSQLCYSSFEDRADLETAWDLQQERRRGQHIPPACREPRVVQYARVAAFADQLERVLRHFPASQVHIVLYADLRRDVLAVYRGILDFLQLEDDGRSEFPVVNPRKAARFGALNRALHTPPAWTRRLMARLSGTRLHDALVKTYGALLRANTRPRTKAGLDPDFRRRLVEFYREDVARLEKILGRQLDDWRR